MDFKQKIGRNITAAREAAGLTKTVAASRVGISFKRLHEYETGVKAPGAEKLVRLAKALGVTVDDLLKGIK